MFQDYIDLGFALFMEYSQFFIRTKNFTWKVSKEGVFSGPDFPVLGLITKIHSINLLILLEYGKIRTRKNFIFGHFSGSVEMVKTILIKLF